MSQITISKETLEKLNNNTFSEEKTSVLKQFLPNRQLRKTKSETQPKPSCSLRIAKPSEKKKDLKTKKDALYISALTKTRNSQPLSKKESKELARRKRVAEKTKVNQNKLLKKTKNYIGNITDHRLPRSVSTGPSTFFYSPRKTKTNAIPHRKTSKSTNGELRFIFDNNDLASEYETRSVEFGHGRKKSLEWNDEIAKSLQKELRKRQRKKPDWTDRFAIK